MKDRIVEIMNKEQLNTTSFAESVGIQRSALAHILSGRNNPSLDVVTKIHQRYSYLNLNWLLYGEGKMVLDQKESYQQADLFNNTPLFSPNPSVESKERKEIAVELPPKPTQPIVKEEFIEAEKAVKKIVEIRIFYSDNTFEIFKGEMR